MAAITRKPRAAPVAQRRPAIEARLLAATEELLSDGTNYADLSVQQLCSEAGIARSTFYVYFRDKGDLVMRLAETNVGRLSEVASTWWQPGASRQQVLRATRELIGTYAENGALLSALTETAACDAEMRRLQVELVERHSRPLERLIEHGKAAGEVREIEARETVAALSWMLQGCCYHFARGATEQEMDRLAEAATAIIWHALYPDARPS